MKINFDIIILEKKGGKKTTKGTRLIKLRYYNKNYFLKLKIVNSYIKILNKIYIIIIS